MLRCLKDCACRPREREVSIRSYTKVQETARNINFNYVIKQDSSVDRPIALRSVLVQENNQLAESAP